MRFLSITKSLFVAATVKLTYAIPYEDAAQHPLTSGISVAGTGSRNLSTSLFASLEELSRIVDISYCVGISGIYHPFTCASRCHEFPHFELINTWNTGPLMSDSCGYIAVDHGYSGGTGSGRIIVAFRGTYSVANTIADLSTVPQEYVPYPTDPSDPSDPPPSKKRHRSFWDYLPWPFHRSFGLVSTKIWEFMAMLKIADDEKEDKCTNCTVHTGFYKSYTNTRPIILPQLKDLKNKYPAYEVHLVGHSLGGAVAGLFGLEFETLGWKPIVTTFGEPRLGNKALMRFIDKKFDLPGDTNNNGNTFNIHGRYRRVTHIDDPVPLLPLREWGYRMHAGEIYISKPSLQPLISDVKLCSGDSDKECIAGAEGNEEYIDTVSAMIADLSHNTPTENELLERFENLEVLKKFENFDILMREDASGHPDMKLETRWGISSRFKLWQLFFAHRDYFWRLGLCIPGGDPLNWGREKYPGSKDPE